MCARARRTTHLAGRHTRQETCLSRSTRSASRSPTDAPCSTASSSASARAARRPHRTQRHTGKTTLTKIISGDLTVHEGAITLPGTLAVMNQFIGKVRDESTVRDLLISV